MDSRWVAAAGLATGLERTLGPVDVLTPRGVMDPDAALDLAVRPEAPTPPGRSLLRSLPRSARVFLGDLRAAFLNLRMRKKARGLSGYRLVVQFHHRFQDSGRKVAQANRAPFVLRMEALEVEEERGWGNARPFWGHVVERAGELRIARAADLVLPISTVIDERLAGAGIDDERRLVVANGVDTDRFSPGPPDAAIERDNDLDGRFVIGWVGGFRPFHGLELISDIARALLRSVPHSVVCLVGDGPLRRSIEDGVRDLEGRVCFPGAVAPEDVPRWIRTFDVCLLPAGTGEFHYSPLKLFEYMACGRAVIAAGVGDVARAVRDGWDALVVPPGDPGAVANAIVRLAGDEELRRRLGAEARRTIETTASWRARAEQIVRFLDLPAH